ncbi:hypothetical protein [Kitasatospora kifunensis]|uniref:Gram-positive cocci surface proteins LPxTG domain-containing protein n=1 Tax=Kitasatospora kifunensis TaxID=58351 RepID=A0A7W7R3C0_KITKI|nr:hypothetical protein [Kitasatospora kifunensis]MBB4924640.1 hypothetical protein [Kitasatospora kifunensis]
MRRSLALAAVGTLASSVVLTGAPAALAAAPFAMPAIVATGSTPPAPAPGTASSSAPGAGTGDAQGAAGESAQRQGQIDQAVPAAVRPRLAVQDLRDKINAGAAPTEFTVRLTNPSHSDLVFYPALRVDDKSGDFDNAALTVDYRRGRQDWRPSTVPTYLDTVRLLGPLDQGGVPTPDALIFVKAGTSVSIEVRLGLPADSPTGPAFAQFISYWAPVDAEQQPTQAGEMSASRPAYFCVLPPGTPKPSQSPTQSGSATPSPSPSATVTPSPSASADSSATPSAKPSPSRTSSPTPSASASAPATATAAPTRSATPSTPAASVSPVTVPPAGVVPVTPSPSSPSSPDTGTVTPFPVPPPAAAAVPIPATAVQQAQAAAASQEKSLAFTGGGSDAGPIAVTGAAVFALGVGTLVLLRRRKGGARHS